jgi:hypothetical protein
MTWPGSTLPPMRRRRRRRGTKIEPQKALERRRRAMETMKSNRLYAATGGERGVRPVQPKSFATLTLDEAAARLGYVEAAIGMPPDLLYALVLERWQRKRSAREGQTGRSRRAIHLDFLCGGRGAVATHVGRPGDLFDFRFPKAKDEGAPRSEGERLKRHAVDLEKLIEYLFAVGRDAVCAVPSVPTLCGRCGRALGDEKKCASCGWFRGPPRKLGTDDLVHLPNVEATRIERISVGDPWDAAWGGGIVPSSTTLTGGRAGSGKTSMLMQLASRIAEVRGRKTLFVNVEMSGPETGLVAQRLGVALDRIVVFPSFAAATDGDVPQFHDSMPAALILDSVSSLVGKNAHAAVEVCKRLKGYASRHGVPVFAVSHIQKEGDFSGLLALQHQVDVCMRLDARGDGLRILRAEKNRYGATHVDHHLVMTATGLVAYPDTQ